MIDKTLWEIRKRFPEEKIGVITVDPSSPVSGGAILGDRIRMMAHSTDPNVFMRSISNKGHLGGLSKSIREMLALLGIGGYVYAILETVGVGQSEVEVSEIADITVVLVSPDMGDGIQMLKAGLLEIGDIFVVTKGDRKGAELTFRELKASLEMEQNEKLRNAPVLMVSSLENRGIDRLTEVIFETGVRKREEIGKRRKEIMGLEVRKVLLDEAFSIIRKIVESEKSIMLESLENGEALVSILEKARLEAEGRKK